MRVHLRFAVVAALCCAAPALYAQGAVSVQGFGYPGGELSTRALSTGGSIADFDANSPINPAALMVGTRATAYIQYDPEFRWVTGPDLNTSTVTARFAPFMVSGKIGKARFSLTYSNFLDRTWTNTYVDSQLVGTQRVGSTVTAVSSGGIADIQAAVSWTFSDKLTIGVGAHVFPGENRVVFGRAFTDTTTFGAFSQTNTFNFSGSAVSLGFVATPWKHINIAASGRYGFSMHVHEGDSTSVGDANVPNRLSISGAYDGIQGSILSVRYGTEQWSALRGLGSPGLTIFDSKEFSAGLETTGPKVGPIPMAVRLGFRTRGLPFGLGTDQIHETELTGGLGIPLSSGRVALDLGLAHALRTGNNIGITETGWIVSVGIAIKPY